MRADYVGEAEALRALEQQEQAEDDLDVLADATPPPSVPTIDDEEPVVMEYPDWCEEDTEVVTCRIANDNYKGRRFETYGEARRTVLAERGRILEQNYVPGRAFFRVLKRAA
jgi:hypothetical protein